ncbi:hypothetical protein DYB28_015105 [Aphanomyces astaci]|uniref:Uncharacterized protein n=1 Tax=Aphanomyces astaci TaxID=112090 RepID=A0A397F4T0_APHAT|nr:hypothetical protein DYB26_005337 [Aphanomyces astaci]RHZ07865.1 hypothetical protein DYB31_006366 [Aphanomyces astaci]RLO01827.1 hypothetical protein DYB28_015105 [Aphanomyces astaci]RQM30606.1 hypothetical protein B5M09_012963 [Aphanomyces astaci]
MVEDTNEKVALTRKRVCVRRAQKSLFQVDISHRFGGTKVPSAAPRKLTFLASSVRSAEMWVQFLCRWNRVGFAAPVLVDQAPEHIETLHLLLKHAYMADEDKFVSHQPQRRW